MTRQQRRAARRNGVGFRKVGPFKWSLWALSATHEVFALVVALPGGGELQVNLVLRRAEA